MFPQLKKHFVLESLMPALFFCHQKHSGFLMVKLKSLKRGEPLSFEAFFALSSEKRQFLFSLAGAEASNHFRRAFFWKPCAFSERHLTKELANPALPGSRSCNKKLLGPERRRKHSV